MILSLIAAHDEARGVGINNTLPWRLPEDLKRFKALTNHKPIVMGRNTFDSLGRLLPNRTHIVLSRDSSWIEETHSKYPEVVIFSDFDVMLSYLKETYKDEVFIIGGNSLWQLSFPHLDKLYLTYVKGMHTVDTYFPAWNKEEWLETFNESHEAFSFVDYIRKSK